MVFAWLALLSPPLGTCSFTRSLYVEPWDFSSIPVPLSRLTDPQRSITPGGGTKWQLSFLTRNDNPKCPYVFLKRSQKPLPVMNPLHLRKSSLYQAFMPEHFLGCREPCNIVTIPLFLLTGSLFLSCCASAAPALPSRLVALVICWLQPSVSFYVIGRPF